MSKILFYFLCFLEIFYKVGFACILFFKKKIYKSRSFPFKVISVGNLSVGGTGKSVFVQFLIKKFINKPSHSSLQSALMRDGGLRLTGKKCAIVLRGYKGKNEKTGKSFLVSDGKAIFCQPDFCGDEAFMLVQNCKVPIVVGSDRAKSCNLLAQKFKDLDIVILDDAYQNFSVKKDYEFLLLDARKPFENGHCLPAGRLREKDYSRANEIILTHADLVNPDVLDNIKNNLLLSFDKTKIFSGKHKVSGLFLLNSKKINLDEVKNKNLLVFAGIGSFDQFVQSVKSLDVEIFKTINYLDHHKYKTKDLKNIIKIIKDNNLHGAITTQKDWVKLLSLIKEREDWQSLPLFVLNISFDFLLEKESKSFFYFSKKQLQYRS